MSRLATRLSRLVLRADLADPMSGFFMLRREAFVERVRSLSGIGFKILLDLFASSREPLRFQEMPYHFRARQAGESKLDGQAMWQGIDPATQTTAFYVWHILTAENFIFGLALITMAFFKNPSKTKFAAWMIAVIMIARWGVIFGSTLPNQANGLAGILVDLIVIIVYAGIIIAGTRQTRPKEPPSPKA
jgi:hypothetical protein